MTKTESKRMLLGMQAQIDCNHALVMRAIWEVCYIWTDDGKMVKQAFEIESGPAIRLHGLMASVFGRMFDHYRSLAACPGDLAKDPKDGHWSEIDPSWWATLSDAGALKFDVNKMHERYQDARWGEYDSIHGATYTKKFKPAKAAKKKAKK